MSASTTPQKSSGLSPDKIAAIRSREGRTPPPAPSAAYARRAREIREDNVGMPAYNAVVEYEAEDGGDVPVSHNVASGYRRARAGTMPSKLHDAAQDYNLPDEPSPPAVNSTPTTANYTRTSALSPAYPQSARPTLRHTASSAANLETGSAANRLRSGSLTLPGAGLGEPFGQGPFGSSWLSTGSHSATPGRSPLGHPDHAEDENPMNDAPRSDSAASLSADDLNFSTLDYLGLADGSDGQLPPASVSEVRRQAQRAIANSGPASRLRASTVSNFARPFRPSVTSAGPYARDTDQYGLRQEEEALARAIENLGMYDSGGYIGTSQLANLYGSTNLLNKDVHRSRATTIGALDQPSRRGGNNPGYLASIPQSPVQLDLSSTYGAGRLYGYPSHSRSERDLTRSRDSSRGPRLSISSHTSRTGTPDVDKGSSTPQVPTRSLWIGNLDVNATSEALLHVFAPYGAIESVRMLPEKTCAFVNFMEKLDAIRARDDVLNRMGGHVSALSETAPVRIGFGKIDSAPNGAGLNTSTAPPPNLVFTTGNNTPAAVTVPPPSIAAVLTTPEQNSDQSSLPTRALWIGSIPGTTSPSTLLQIFSPFGPVESARVLVNKCCGFVNFERLDSAVSARNALNGRDILGSDVGIIRIGFARVPTKSPTLGGSDDEDSALGDALNTVNGAAAVSTEQQLSAEGGGVENYRSQLVIDLVKQGVHEQVLEKGLANDGVVSEQQMIMQVLSADAEEDGDVKAAADNRPPVTYYTSIPPVPARPSRRFEASKLKDLKKKLDAGQCRQDDIDVIAQELMEECAELSSDYIGNTIIQKLFERTSPTVRFAMLERIAPHLATIGVHKNGTWAAQKIIECSVTSEERQVITSNLRAFAPPLMCDSLGNYVCAGTLRFGAPWNDYVFDAMIDRMWEIAQNRFGARCMRTCLEARETSLYQRKRIATGIILNSIPLATNPNGALLLTWLVDTSNLPGRYGLLANRFIPHVAHLCTHKLASLTVLRVIAQTSEPSAASNLVQAIFTSTNDQTLIEILSDASNGSQVIGKIIAITTISSEQKTMMLDAVRRVLPGIKAANTPPYRLLLEAVGLPVPAGYIGNSPFGRGQQQQDNGWQNQNQNNYSGQNFYPYHQSMAISPGGYGSNNNNLSPLLIPQNMPLGQSMRNGSPNLGAGGNNKSPRTPVPGRRDRMSSPGNLLSPGSDPFNPFASPSVDLPYAQQATMRLGSALAQPPVTFEAQPNIGGLGIMSQQAPGHGLYYGQRPVYGQTGYQ